MQIKWKMAPITGFFIEGGQDTHWLFSITAKDDKLPTLEHNLFELTFGWAPMFMWQWFGQHPANYISFRLYKADNSFWWDQYCFAAQASSNGFSIKQGTDRDGKYLDVVAGPVSMGHPGNGDCDSSSPMKPSGTLTLTVRYRCNDIDNHRLGFPDWAEWVCQ